MDSRVLWLGSGEFTCFQTREVRTAVLQLPFSGYMDILVFENGS